MEKQGRLMAARLEDGSGVCCGCLAARMKNARPVVRADPAAAEVAGEKARSERARAAYGRRKVANTGRAKAVVVTKGGKKKRYGSMAEAAADLGLTRQTLGAYLGGRCSGKRSEIAVRYA